MPPAARGSAVHALKASVCAVPAAHSAECAQTAEQTAKPTAVGAFAFALSCNCGRAVHAAAAADTVR